jgi:hypothetical protein
MERPSKKEIKAALDRLKAPNASSSSPTGGENGPAPTAKKSNKNRIRKQGV